MEVFRCRDHQLENGTEKAVRVDRKRCGCSSPKGSAKDNHNVNSAVRQNVNYCEVNCATRLSRYADLFLSEAK